MSVPRIFEVIIFVVCLISVLLSEVSHHSHWIIPVTHSITCCTADVTIFARYNPGFGSFICAGRTFDPGHLSGQPSGTRFHGNLAKERTYWAHIIYQIKVLATATFMNGPRDYV
jgi:hypothetical protein